MGAGGQGPGTRGRGPGARERSHALATGFLRMARHKPITRSARLFVASKQRTVEKPEQIGRSWRKCLANPISWVAITPGQDFQFGIHSGLRHSREITLFCLSKMTQHHTGAGALLPPGKRAPEPLGPPAKTNWLGKRNGLRANRSTEAGLTLYCPRANVGKSCS